MKKYLEYQGGLYIGGNIIISPSEYATELNWDQSLIYCDKLVIQGYKNWRLPTRKELLFIEANLKEIRYEKYKFYLPYYWTSTEESKYYAWVEGLKGFSQSCGKHYMHGVRPVKTID